MRVALVANGIVRNVILADAPAPWGGVEAPEWVGPGDLYDGTFTKRPTAPQTDEQKRNGIQRLAWAKIVAASGGNEARARVEMARRAAPWVGASVAIHAAMDALLAMNPIPDDYADSSYWP